MSQIVTEKLNNGNTIRYKIVNGTAYHEETPDVIVRILENAREERKRLTIHYGDVKTGDSWGDVISCYVGRSGGNIQIPLEVSNSRSMGGGAMLDDCIVKIETSKGKVELYKHANFRPQKPYTIDVTLRIKNWGAVDETKAKQEVLERLEQFHVLAISK